MNQSPRLPDGGLTTLRLGRAGAAARATIGAALIAYELVWHDPGWWELGTALLVLPPMALGAAIGVNAAFSESAVRRGRVPWSAVQMVAAGLILVVVIVLGTTITFVSPVDGGALYLFFGGSMILASCLGYEGCEILALPNLVLRRRHAIWCPLYSPLDKLDEPETGTLHCPEHRHGVPPQP